MTGDETQLGSTRRGRPAQAAVRRLRPDLPFTPGNVCPASGFTGGYRRNAFRMAEFP